VGALGLSLSSLPYEIVVATPTNEPITTSHACLDCLVWIEGRIFFVNLIFLPLSHLDVMLGMDWLSSNHIPLNCKDKTLIFGASTPSSLRSRSLETVKDEVVNHVI